MLRYSGEYWDDTTGLQYLRARWYDPGVGRFMGEDTYQGEVTDPLSLNLYTYVGNNPLIYVDPSGHSFETLDYQELRILLNEASVQSNSTKNKDYQVYKDFIRNRYDFVSIFGGANQYNYLYDLVTGTSAYNNSAGKSDWAREQLLSAYQSWTDAEVLALAAGSLVGGGTGKSAGFGKKPNKTTKWDIKTNAKAKVNYNFNGQKVTAYQDNTKKGYWWAKDTIGHGGSAFKVFEKRGNELHWVADADEYGNFITGKHKSQTGTVIKLK
ncbi:RHS repeat-associated core domain-containing protein [Paenibacillus medicaginis]|uniref:RHS repeat-associated core domain-containing protein n=1 Tax=Paenibacillus medicaginis TaxID=1470560 RepID=A0ABV5BX39_9BACL